jgi:hypothetical protein
VRSGAEAGCVASLVLRGDWPGGNDPARYSRRDPSTKGTGYGQLQSHDCRGLAARLAGAADDKMRWKLVWEFLEEYRWEPGDAQPSLLRDEPPATGDERWDALLAALAEHLAARHDLAPPDWAELRVLRRPWFPAQLRVQRADALVHAR